MAKVIIEALQLCPPQRLREPKHRRDAIKELARYADWVAAGEPAGGDPTTDEARAAAEEEQGC